MTTFVLVHGAWHGGWCYKRVARFLRQAGHEVYTPTLTGLGERAHLMNWAIDLATHVQDIVGVIRYEELSDVVLCGIPMWAWTSPASPSRSRTRSVCWSISTPSFRKTVSHCLTMCPPNGRDGCDPMPCKTETATK